MFLKLDANYKDLQVDYEKEGDTDKFYIWGISSYGVRTIIMSMTEEEASALCSALDFALQDRGITRKEAESGDKG